MKHINKFRGRSFKVLQRSKIYRYLIFMLVFATTFALLAMGLLPEKYSLEAGQVSSEAIYAPRTVVDSYLTKIAEDEAVAAVPEVYNLDPSITATALNGLTKFYESLEVIAKEEEPEEQELLIEELSHESSKERIIKFINLPEEQREGIYTSTYQILAQILNQGVKSEAQDIENARTQIFQEINLLTTDMEIREFLLDINTKFVTANFIYSAESTERDRIAARREVAEVKILKDSKIIDKGEVVTELHIAQLEVLGLQETSSQDFGYYLGLGILLTMVFTIMGVYLYIYNKEILYDSHQLLLLGIIFCITLLLAKAFNYFSPFLIPITLAPLLTTILFDKNIAMVIIIPLAILSGITVGYEFSFMVLALVSGIAAVFTVKNVNQRSDLTRAGVIIAAVNAFTLLGIALLTGSYQGATDFIKNISLDIIMGMVAALISSILTIGLLPFLESTFGVTTSIRLLELANPNNGALKRLLIETPGTYHHSIIVGNLAEAAAEEVGADPILARVGAYYHDIGKVSQPYYFIENQLGDENIHDSLGPFESKDVIINHVKEGVEIASKFGLPPVIKDLIQQHHGTTKIEYFYHRAKAQDGEDTVNEEDFRYNGPKPQTKVAAIIMLADSVEAAVRSLKQPTKDKIEDIITAIINDKMKDGQLDECDLTLAHIKKIKVKFSKVLLGIFHQRIQYPNK